MAAQCYTSLSDLWQQGTMSLNLSIWLLKASEVHVVHRKDFHGQYLLAPDQGGVASSAI